MTRIGDSTSSRKANQQQVTHKLSTKKQNIIAFFKKIKIENKI